MRVTVCSCRFLFIAFYALVLCSSPLQGRDPEADLKRILGDWQQRQKKIRTIRYKVVGERTTPKGHYNGDPDLPPEARGAVPSEDCSTEETISLIIDFDKNWARKEVRTQLFSVSLAKFIPYYAVRQYDGSRFKAYTPREDNTSEAYSPAKTQPDIVLGKKILTGAPFFSLHEYPLLFAHGNLDREASDPRHLRNLPGVRAIRVHGYSMHDGRECVVVRTTPRGDQTGMFDEFWVDLLREGAVLRATRFMFGQTSYRMDIEHQQSGNTWLPLSWTATFYPPSPKATSPGRFASSYRFRVAELQVNSTIDEKELEIKPKPHMVVKDLERDQLYRVRTDGTLTPLSASGNEIAPGRWPSVWWVLTVITACLFVVAIARRFIRRFLRPSGTTVTDA